MVRTRDWLPGPTPFDPASYGLVGSLISPLPKLDNSKFTWVNQGGATETKQQNGAVTLYAPSNAGDQNRLRVTTWPSAPFSFTAAFQLSIWPINYAFGGVVLYDSGSTKLITFGLGCFNGANICSLTFPSPGGSGTAYIINNASWSPSLITKIYNDGTNLNYYTSWDGVNFVLIAQKTLTDFLPAITHYGYFVDSNNSHPVYLDVYGWAIGNS